MKPRHWLSIAASLALWGTPIGCVAATPSTPASDPVSLNLRSMSVSEMEAVLAQHTPVAMGLADVQAFVKNRLVLDHPYDGRGGVFPEPGGNYLAKEFSQPLAVKCLSVHVGRYRPLLGFGTDYEAVYFFDKADRLLSARIRKTVDGL